MKPTLSRSDTASPRLRLIGADRGLPSWPRRRTLLFVLGAGASLWAVIFLGYWLIF